MADALYDSIIADYYDSSPLVSGRKQDVAFYLAQAAASRGPVLELGCGTGRIAIPVAESGLHITGSGYFPENAAAGRAKALFPRAGTS